MFLSTSKELRFILLAVKGHGIPKRLFTCRSLTWLGMMAGFTVSRGLLIEGIERDSGSLNADRDLVEGLEVLAVGVRIGKAC